MEGLQCTVCNYHTRPSFRRFRHSFLRSFPHSVPSFLRSVVPSFLRSFVPSFLRCFVPSFLRSFARSVAPSHATQIMQREPTDERPPPARRGHGSHGHGHGGVIWLHCIWHCEYTVSCCVVCGCHHRRRGRRQGHAPTDGRTDGRTDSHFVPAVHVVCLWGPELTALHCVAFPAMLVDAVVVVGVVAPASSAFVMASSSSSSWRRHRRLGVVIVVLASSSSSWRRRCRGLRLPTFSVVLVLAVVLAGRHCVRRRRRHICAATEVSSILVSVSVALVGVNVA